MDLKSQLNTLLTNSRSHAAYFAIGEKDRDEKETNELLNFEEAYNSCSTFREVIGAADEMSGISQGGRSFELSDPPDIHITFKNGNKVGVEITNIVDQASLHLAEKGDHTPKDWTKSDFLSQLNRLLRKKDKAWDGAFNHKVVLMLCDEPYLSHKICREFLKESEFNTSQINTAFLFFSPEPLQPTGEGILIPVTKDLSFHARRAKEDPFRS